MIRRDFVKLGGGGPPASWPPPSVLRAAADWRSLDPRRALPAADGLALVLARTSEGVSGLGEVMNTRVLRPSCGARSRRSYWARTR